jgi:hypothetical protein
MEARRCLRSHPQIILQMKNERKRERERERGESRDELGILKRVSHVGFLRSKNKGV